MKQVMENSVDSSTTASQHPQLPPGFRFYPTDEELVVHYLKRKADSASLPVTIIAEVDLYKFDPWELPSKASFGEQEWYFFSPRDRKYPNGARPNRAATSGYWKATGTDKLILTSDGNQKVGVKKALVFYGGKPPKGVKTNWIMHEYRLTDKSISKPPVVAVAADHAQTNNNKKNSSRLDDWVLCRIYMKPNNMQRPMNMMMEQRRDDSMATLVPFMPQLSMKATSRGINYGALGIENDDNFFEGILAPEQGIQQHGSDSHAELGSSSITKNTFPSKRELPTQFWNETAAVSAAASSASKRFHGDLYSGTGSIINGTHEDNNSFISLLSQIPQNSSFPQNSLIASVTDGALRQQFQLSSVNWNS